MSYSFVRTYKLSQQTPLIHFQYDQEGATLRATEVKPKLDSYLIKHCHIPKDSPFRLKNGKDDADALDYKLQFDCPSSEPIELGLMTPYDIYYGNMGPNVTPVKGIMARERITCRIICLNQELRACIDQHIADFFTVTNFGRMQRKGFGSFLVVEDDQRHAIPEPNEQQVAKLLCTEYNARNCYCLPAGVSPFKRVKTLYGLMKSGVNFRVYQKSLLFQYMSQRGLPNEKHGLKVKRLAPKIYKPQNINRVYVPLHQRAFHEDEQSKFYYVRALLGLGDHLEFKGQSDERKNRSYSVVNQAGEVLTRTQYAERVDITIDIKATHTDDLRLKSPIFFKIIGNKIFYVGEPVNEDILGKTFAFTSYWDDRAARRGQIKKKVEFSVPTKEQLGDPAAFIDAFLEYVYDQRRAAFNGLDDLKDMAGLMKKYNQEGGVCNV